MISGRALHHVFKIADRSLNTTFFRDVLGMKVLRHEEFSEGCEAACNGPYANRWSKTMIGYGSEDNNFVVELTYNYGITAYELGNDFRGITIRSKESIERAMKLNWPIQEENEFHVLESPDGYKFYLINEAQPTNTDPIEKVTLSSSNLKKSIDYWNGVLGLTIYNQTEANAVFGFADNQAKVELQVIGTALNRAKAYGRIAFSCPYEQQPKIDELVKQTKNTILTPLITLDTPGKATVRVIILADPDGHEICFVEDGGYRKLSEFDPKADDILNKYIAKDQSRG